MRWLYSYINEALSLPGVKSGSIISLEGLRGWAAMLVFFVHYCSMITEWGGQAAIVMNAYLMEMGRIGVDVFFVLSGFLIYRGVFQSKSFSFPVFAKGRLRRIFPLYWVCFFMTFGALILTGKLVTSADDWLAYLSDVFLVSTLLGYKPVVTVSWTLTFELLFYVSVPLVLILLNAKKLPRKWRAGIILFSLVSLYAYFFENQGKGPERIIMFLVGVLVYELRGRFRVNGIVALLALVGVAGYVFMIVHELHFMASIGLLTLSLFLFSMYAFRETCNSTLLTNALARYMGKISYSYYLFHGLALHAGLILLNYFVPKNDEYGVVFFLLSGLLMIVFTIIFSAFMYFIFEYPLSIKKRHKKGA